MKLNYEKSCGAVVFHEFEDKYKILILNFNYQKINYWGFPNGHIEKDETEIQTAIREIKEETGLRVKITPDFKETTEFTYENGTRHEVVYFATESNETDIKPQKDELEIVVNKKWCDFNEAKNLLTFDCDKEILEKFINFLENKI